MERVHKTQFRLCSRSSSHLNAVIKVALTFRNLNGIPTQRKQNRNHTTKLFTQKAPADILKACETVYEKLNTHLGQSICALFTNTAHQKANLKLGNRKDQNMWTAVGKAQIVYHPSYQRETAPCNMIRFLPHQFHSPEKRNPPVYYPYSNEHERFHETHQENLAYSTDHCACLFKNTD